MIGLYKLSDYIFAPNRREFNVKKNGPIHKPKKSVVNTYYVSPELVFIVTKQAVNIDINKGPHKSHYFLNLS